VRGPLAGALAALLPAGCGAAAEREVASAPRDEATATPAATGSAMPPLPKARPKLVAPQAGEASELPGEGLGAATVSAVDTSLPKPEGPASDGEVAGSGDPAARGLTATRATALPNGSPCPRSRRRRPSSTSSAPATSSPARRTSGAAGTAASRTAGTTARLVSYARYYAGLIDGPTCPASWWPTAGRAPGKRITIHPKPGPRVHGGGGHPLRPSGARETGSRWQNELYGNRGGAYEVRHPPGL
jgi:hypothetical protein